MRNVAACNLGSGIEPSYLISWPCLPEVLLQAFALQIGFRLVLEPVWRRRGCLKGYFFLFCAWGICTVGLQMQFAADLSAGGKEARWETP